MLETLFLKLVNISITASWFALAVMVFRVLFRKAPKVFHVGLWALVGIRLMLPFSIESIFSMVPSAETIPEGILYATEPKIHSGVEILNSTLNPILSTSLAPEIGASVNPIQIIVFLASNFWVLGMILMMSYTVISYFRIQKSVREAIWTKDEILLCDRIDSPFVLGVLRPRIYIPSTLGGCELEYVIAHEKAHIQRRDYLWKPLGFLLLSIYWFNPILWIAYILLCRDIEFACDEKVIGNMGMDSKKPYSMALIDCSVSRKSIAACPLAFGEVGVKSRIKSVLHYKKPAFWLMFFATMATCILAVLFLTSPVTSDIHVITEEKGYEIINQEAYDLLLEIPKEILVEEVYSREGKEFESDEVIVYESETSTIYVKQILQSGDETNRLDFIFDISYHDLDKYNEVIVPYEISDLGYTFMIKARDEAAMTRGTGPESSFTFTINIDLVQQSEDKMVLGLTANELTYRKKSLFKNLSSTEQTLEGYHAYICDRDGKGDMSVLRLYYEENRFTFSESVLSSYLGFGSYTLKDDELILKTDDDLYTYVFKVSGKQLILNDRYVYKSANGKW